MFDVCFVNPPRPYLVDPKAQVIRATVPEKDLHLLRPGLTGVAKPTGFPDREIKVRVAAVTAVPVAPGQFEAKLELDSPPGPVVPGMTCTVRLATEAKE